ncbi:MAG: DUF3237 family protein [Clostridia bacterium]|nr:DUF3237 family protein [Clostridia bacterium]
MTILNISVFVTRVQDVVSPRGTARMILFNGTCSGDYFTGTIDPGGVDTQYLDRNGSGTLSARYSLSGTDRDGRPARIFIENNARTGEETHPRVWTDSPCLAFLETAELIGHIRKEDDHLLITIETDD